MKTGCELMELITREGEKMRELFDRYENLLKEGRTVDASGLRQVIEMHIESLEKENASLKQDATRYRALCSSGAYAPSSFRSAPWGLVTGNTQSQSKASLDAAVDAYIVFQVKQGEQE